MNQDVKVETEQRKKKDAETHQCRRVGVGS